MADEEAEQERLSCGEGGCVAELQRLGERLQELELQLRESRVPAVEAATDYCQQLCQTLLEYAEKWKTSEDPLPLLEVYTVAIQSYVKARPYLTSECENVALVLERLALSCVELLLCLPVELSDKQWEQFQTLVQVAHEKLMENGSCELHFLATLAQETGVWKNPVLCTILSQEPLDKDKVNEFLAFEGPILLDMRIKHLIKTNQLSQATALAKLCSDHPEIGIKGSFKQTYLVCLCTSSPNGKLIEEISEVDCKDALEMICNLESEGDEKSALVLCTAFLSRQLQQGDMYCAWELTLFWSKLQQRVEPSIQVYLERCRQLSLLTKTVYHIFFLIKVINSETEGAGLATCIELCVKALRLESTENTEVKISICKTISCLLPDDLEVKRACQLSEFLIEPTVDAYYAVEMLYNQPDQKYDEENLPIPNSLRCELLLVLKTQWPFDPEFWDWKTLKRQCLALMGEEASIVSSIDELNDSEVYEKVVDYQEESKETSMNGLSGGVGANSGLLKDIGDEKQKKREIKQLRERGFISARFRNWQAYMQYCVLCDKEFLGHRIVRHAQKHYKDGIYSCPICAKNFNSKETFVPHVTLHVKQSSKERLAAMKPLRRLGRPPKITTTNENQKTNTVAKQEQRPIKKNSLYSTDFIVFNDNDGSDDENDDKDKSYEPEVIPVQKPVPVNEFNCPVTFCKKGFKYFKNLIAHVKGHKDNEDAKRFLEMQSKKVICQYCRRHFVSVTHLNDHLQMHCGSKPYICIQMKCKAGFNSYAELLTHRKEHQVFRAKCMFPKCGRIFSEAYLLYDHEAQHYNTYTCKFTGCGKVYRSQGELEKHLDDHSTPPEKVLPPEAQLNSSGDSIQPSEVNQNTAENIEKERSMLPSENNIENSLLADRSDAWDKSKAESAVTKQDQISASELRQANGPLSNGLENPATTPLLQSSEVAVSIKVSLNQGIEDNFGKQENSTVEGSGEALVTDLHTPVEDTCNDLCHPGFQERKEQDCFNDAHVTQNSLVNSETLKIGDLTPQNLERQVNNLMTFSVQNQAAFQNNLPTSKFECGDNVKTSSNLYNLPLKTLESIAFVPPQSDLSNSLGTPSVPPKAPVQKFSCQVEGCTRTYNSSQSIGKHMKTAHPDQYAAFKMQRKSKKGQKANNLNTPNNGKFVYFLPSPVNSSNPFFTSQTKANGNPACSAQLQHVSPPIFPAHLASVSTPLLSSMESVINPNITSQDKNEQGGMLCSQMENLPSTALPAQMEDLTKTVLPLNIDSGSDPFLPLPAESSSMSLFPSPADSGTNSVFSQLENNTNHYSSQIEGNTNSSFLKGGNGENAVFPSQVNVANNFSSTNAQQSAPEKVKKDRGRGPNGKERKPKHNKRAKWPAIIRDGKFICSRCYRAFTNPRSLGGHLSKRSYCKPLDGAEIAQELLQSNGQPSLLASMILSTNAVNLQQPQQSTFNPEACFKDPSFLQLLAENRSPAFLPNTFPRSGVTNFNTSVSQEGSEIIKQALETAGIPSTFEGAEMLSHVSTGCVSDASQVNATVMPNPTVPPLLHTVCHPNTLLTNQNRTSNSKTSSIEECSSLPVFPTNDLLLKTVENGLCSSSFPNSGGPSQNFTSNSSRVSVISGPQNTRSSHLNKKGNSASKRRKKVAPPLIAPNASQNLVTSDLTTMGLIAKSVEIPTTNLHSNVIPTCEPQSLVENLTQKLNNVNNQLFMTDVKENFKTSLESHTVLAPLTLKTENGDSQMMALNSCTTSINSDLQISEDNVIQNFEKTLEIIKTAMNSQILEVKSGSQGAGETSQNAQINYNIQLPSVNTVQNNKLPDSSPFSSFISVMPTKSNIPQSEVSHKEDQIQEILEGLQKLKLENDLSTPASQCVLINTSVTLTPTPVKSTADITVIQPVSEMINIQFNDKVNKPFVCQNQGCNYSAMTKDALFKHYGKIHQYTPEMILEIKKNQLKFAPFKCVVPTCTKTFTRNSNLRAHCQLVHHFTTEEMVKLKIKRPYGRKSQSENVPASRSTQVKKQLAMTEENKKESQPALELRAETQNTHSNVAVIPEKQLVEKKSPDKTESSLQVITVTSEQCNTNALTNTQTKGRKIRRHKKEKEEKKRKKPVSQSLEFPTRYSPYRPYRCVHQGCFAAFTIQQNLILHYQAVHKSDLPAFSAEVEEESEAGKESEETETKQTLKEFRCQVSDCSRIFQAITGLIQHYMKLHEMTPEEIESMTASVDVGKFPCDQLECKSSFTTYLNYVVHLEADHGIGLRASKTEEDGVYKCDCEGCDRIYATRSNLLRHIFNKHNDKHKAHLIRPRRLTPGQENMSSKANQEKSKSKHRGTKHSRCGKEGIKMPKTKRKKKNNLENKNAKIVQIEENKPYSLKRGKHVYSIKARNDALSECTSRFVTQYPCMIKGCTSVVTSESNIIRHYKCHKLSKAFTSQHRNLLIVFKRCCNSQVKETSEQEGAKNDVKDSDTCVSESNDNSRTTATVSQKEVEKNEKDEMDELTELFITKLINEDSTSVETQANTSSNVSNDFQEDNLCQSERQKASNLKRVNKEKNVSQNKKRKVEKAEPASAAELSSVRKEEETAVAIQTIEEHPASFDWSSFKPMGFEVSFLKFLEESAVKQKKNTDKDHPNTGNKKGSHSNSRKNIDKTAVTSGNHVCPCKESETFVQFANPSQLQCSDNVKIVLDKNLKDCTELVLKQLQEMKPTVSLKKLEVHSNDPDMSVMKDISIGKATGRGQY
ncbi:zinc finger protein 292 [Homo sapiens]|uniref:Zinc finger protein 292 n=6 Tax=Homo sapiens TaxID=9606 RepID=ZN292_HUMAN|nr:zinc finger protein 292 isoform 1 [Homo sapiens]O60281.3 RecName: Full=Zinc finger protein 292 [Homo sapiens]AAI72360.1 Zinc finger protein 292 [synthetic construct]EAW48607.1 hCG1640214, isoform CRA_a [Homo sapiens]KAI4019080.1 zinc finger protein 292 [Homo sapiens]|eukprot:NP_055836.1 zinc finger protein 292 isoform 1 [Homo sapiens]